jgi:uncharacterized delta-60 repeat protein
MVMSNRSQRLLLAAVLSLQFAGMVQAQLIDVDFNTNSAAGSGGGPAIGPTMSGAAVLGAAGDRWNGIDVSSGTGIPLIYANGSNSPVAMTFTSGGGYDVNSYGGSTPFASTPLDALMEDYLYSGGVAQTVTLSGLTPNSMYDVVLYNAADVNGAGRTTYFTVNTNIQSSTWNGSSNTLIAGVDYVEFTSAVSDASGNLAITWTGNGSQEGDLNGFQIQFKPGPATPGLDASFAGSGKTLISFGDGACAAYAVAIQPDGRIVVAGATNIYSSSGLAMARLNTNGSLDLSFGVNGKVTTPGVDDASAVAIQSDGKIVAGGGYSEFELARYNTNGSLDTSFGSNGVTTLPFSNGDGHVRAVQLQSNGKIIAAGYANDANGKDQFTLARFNTNGTLDTTFGSGGTVMTTFSGVATLSSAYGAGIQPDGKIVAGGFDLYATSGATVESDLAAARYQTNGALDFSFGSLGRATNNVGGGTLDFAYAMAIQPDGKIVLAGGAGINTLPPIQYGNGNVFVALARFDTNGAPDTTFGNYGTVITQVGAFSDYALSMAIQPNGKILVAGASQNGNYEWFVQRYNSDGSNDPTYGDNGVRFVNFGSGTNEIAYAMALDSSGRAVVVGDAGGLFGVARLLQDAAPVSLRISLTPTHTVLISWPYPSTGWNLQQNSDLATTNWTMPTETVANDGTNNFIVINPPSGNLFFRLRQ